MALMATMSAASNEGSATGQQISPLRWETLKPVILYLYQRMPLTSLMAVMEQDYSFVPTRNSYKSQLRQWGMSNRARSRKAAQLHDAAWPSSSVRDVRLSRDTVRNHLSNKLKKTLQIPIRERPGRRRRHPPLNEGPDPPALPSNEQMELPPIPDTRAAKRTCQVDEASVSDSEDDNKPPPSTLTRERFLQSHDSARWSVLHQALLLGVIRGKMLPYLYPTKAAMFSDQFLGSTLTFSLMKIFEALTFIEQQQCGLEELLLTAYLITNNAMTPPTSTADATWAKVGFLAFGKACSVLKELEPTYFRNKQASEFEFTVQSEHFTADAWSCKYVSLLCDEDLHRYDINDWEDKMFKVIENLMRFASCNPDWRSIKVQTQLQIQHQKTQTAILSSIEV